MSQLVSTVVRSLDAEPEKWTCNGFELTHPKATVWIANGSWGLSIKSKSGQWGGVRLFTAPFTPRRRLWKAFIKWQGAKLAAEFAA